MRTSLASGLGTQFASTVTSGPLLVAIGVAAVAGLVSFASPCVLPLVPGYLAYVAGLSGADTTARAGGAPPGLLVRGRVFVGALLFVLGFTAVFVSYGTALGNLGASLIRYQDPIQRVLGAVTIVLGLTFLGLIPLLQREVRIHRLPTAGLAGAPLLGVLFGVGWTPASARPWARYRPSPSPRPAPAAAPCWRPPIASGWAFRSYSPHSGCAAVSAGSPSCAGTPGR